MPPIDAGSVDRDAGQQRKLGVQGVLFQSLQQIDGDALSPDGGPQGDVVDVETIRARRQAAQPLVQRRNGSRSPRMGKAVPANRSLNHKLETSGR